MNPYTVATAIEPSALMQQATPTLQAERLGLRDVRFVGRKGDLLVLLSSATLAEGAKEEPVLVLANARAPRERHVLVPLSHLWRMLEPEAMRTVAPTLCRHLYGVITQDDLFRVMDALYDFADDLKDAPPPPRLGAGAWYDALARDGFTFTVNGEQVTD